MRRFTRGIIESLLERSSKDKEAIGSRLVVALGGDPTKRVTGLPARRGTQDGGIDGRVPVYRSHRNVVKLESGDGQFVDSLVGKTERGRFDAGISVKLEKHPFNREQFYGFLGDLKREQLVDGVIISAVGPSQDPKSLMANYDAGEVIRIWAITLQEILEGSLPPSRLEFVRDPRECLLEAIAGSASNSRPRRR